MAQDYQQTDTIAPCGAIGACSGRTAATDADGREAQVGGTPGVTAAAVGIPLNSTVAGYMDELAIADTDSLDAGTLTARLNVSTAQADLTLEEIFVCRLNSSCTSQETLGSLTGLATDISAGGVFAQNVTLSAASAHNAGDVVYIVYVFANAHTHTARSLEILPDQIINTPFTGSATAGDVTSPGSVRISVAGETVDVSSLRAALPAEGASAASLRAALLDAITNPASTRLMGPGEVTSPASYRSVLLGESTSPGSAKMGITSMYRTRLSAVTDPQSSADHIVSYTLRKHGDVSVLSLPGTEGNNASTSDSDALDITENIDIRVAAALDSWNSSNQALITKWGAATAQNAYLLRMSGAKLRLFWEDSTDATFNATSTVDVVVVDGKLLLVRVTLDVDDGSGNAVVTFYTKDSTPSKAHTDLLDNAGWTQLGDPVSVAGTTNDIIVTGSELEIGSVGTQHTAGKFYSAAILNGINGTVVFAPDFSAAPLGATSLIEGSANAATVTINQSGDPQAEIVEDAGERIDAKVRLMEGVNEIASWNENDLTDTTLRQDRTLSAAQADAISTAGYEGDGSLSGLYLEFWEISVGDGTARALRVEWAQMRVPVAGAATGEQTMAASAIIKVAGEVTSPASLRTALLGSTTDPGSADLALPGDQAFLSTLRAAVEGESTDPATERIAGQDDTVSQASLRAALQDAAAAAASVALALPGDSASAADLRAALAGEATSPSDLRLALLDETATAADLRIAALTGQRTDPATLRTALQAVADVQASARVAGQGEQATSASVLAALLGERIDAADLRVAARGESASPSSARTAGQAERTDAGSLRAALLAATSDPASFRAALRAARSDPGSLRVALLGQTTDPASLRTALSGSAASTATLRIALLAAASDPASLVAALQASRTDPASLRTALLGEQVSPADIRIALPGSEAAAATMRLALPAVATDLGSMVTALVAERTDPASLLTALLAESVFQATANIASGVAAGESTSAASYRTALRGTLTSPADIRIATLAEATALATLRAVLLGTEATPASTRVAAQAERTDDATLRAALAAEQAAVADYRTAQVGERADSASARTALSGEASFSADIRIAGAPQDAEALSAASLRLALAAAEATFGTARLALVNVLTLPANYRAAVVGLASADGSIRIKVIDNASVLLGAVGIEPTIRGTAGIRPTLEGEAGMEPTLTGTAGLQPGSG